MRRGKMVISVNKNRLISLHFDEEKRAIREGSGNQGRNVGV